MAYQDIRGQIKSGDIIALTHTSWASWYDLQVQFVRFGTQSEYSHVGMVLVYADRVWLLESVVPYVRIVPLSLMVEDGFYWIPNNVEVSEDEFKFIMSTIGKARYSKWQAFLAGLKKLDIGGDELWECAEWLIVARRRSGMDLGNVATPSAVVKLLQEKYNCAVHFVKG